MFCIAEIATRNARRPRRALKAFARHQKSIAVTILTRMRRHFVGVLASILIVMRKTAVPAVTRASPIRLVKQARAFVRPIRRFVRANASIMRPTRIIAVLAVTRALPIRRVKKTRVFAPKAPVSAVTNASIFRVTKITAVLADTHALATKFAKQAHVNSYAPMPTTLSVTAPALIRRRQIPIAVTAIRNARRLKRALKAFARLPKSIATLTAMIPMPRQRRSAGASVPIFRPIRPTAALAVKLVWKARIVWKVPAFVPQRRRSVMANV